MGKRIEINAKLANKVLDVVGAGLVSGVGVPVPGKMCVEAAVCYALGLPHGDDPPCVHDDIVGFKISLNDLNWSTSEARARGLRRIAIAQLGTAQNVAKFNHAAFQKTVQRYILFQLLPAVLTALYRKQKTLPSCQDGAQSCLTALGLLTVSRSVEARVVAAEEICRDRAIYSDYVIYPSTIHSSGVRQVMAHLVYCSADGSYGSLPIMLESFGKALGFSLSRSDSLYSALAEDFVQMLVAHGAPGAKYLYLTEN